MEEKFRWDCKMTGREEELTADMVPPAVPMAGSEKTWSRWWGKKERNLASEKDSSLDSCKRAM